MVIPELSAGGHGRLHLTGVHTPRSRKRPLAGPGQPPWGRMVPVNPTLPASKHPGAGWLEAARGGGRGEAPTAAFALQHPQACFLFPGAGGGGAQRQESQSPALTEKVALAWEAAEGRAAPQRRAVGWPRRVVRASGTGLRRFRGGQLSLEAPPCRGREAPVVKAHPANTHTEQQTSFPTS